MKSESDPFFGAPPKEVPLKNAPLIRVLAQISFNEIASIGRKDFIAPFQEEIRSIYPVLRSEEGFSFDSATLSGETQRIWRFYDRSDEWRVSLTTTFLSLETMRYTSREDFVERVASILAAADKVFSIVDLTRVGLRYIDRIEGPSLERLGDLVEKPILGIQGAGLPLDPAASHMTQMFTPVLEGGLGARWGTVPANGTPDPSVILPVPGNSWILDIDVFAPLLQGQTVAVGDVKNISRDLAARAYTFFRWATTDAFMAEYGGTA